MKRISSLATVIVLISLLAALGCDLITPAPTPAPYERQGTQAAQTLTARPAPTGTPALVVTDLPTDVPPPTQAPAALSVPPEPLDRRDIRSVVRWLSYALLQGQPGIVAALIGNNGVDFGGAYASEVVFPAYNNSEAVVGGLQRALLDAAPTCMGYEAWFGAMPDKANIFIRGLRFDWQTEVSSFGLFYLENGWELVSIVGVPDDMWPEASQRLVACP